VSLLLVLLILALIFGGLGVAWHVFWWLILILAVIAVYDLVTGRR